MTDRDFEQTRVILVDWLSTVLTQAVALFGCGVASFLAPCLVPLRLGGIAEG